MKKHILLPFLTFFFILPAGAQSATDILGQLGGVISNLTQKSEFDLANLTGTWTYESPAITFKSDNALNKIGGAAASAGVEAKLAPYYKRIGIDKVQIVFDADHNFTITMRGRKLRGTVSRPEEGSDAPEGALVFNFNAFGKTNIGHVSAMAAKSATGTLTLTFDASRFIDIVQKVAAVSQNQSIKSLAAILGSYDGLYAGARLRKSR